VVHFSREHSRVVVRLSHHCGLTANRQRGRRWGGVRGVESDHFWQFRRGELPDQTHDGNRSRFYDHFAYPDLWNGKAIVEEPF
jgi:hypothetical protein